MIKIGKGYHILSESDMMKTNSWFDKHGQRAVLRKNGAWNPRTNLHTSTNSRNEYRQIHFIYIFRLVHLEFNFKNRIINLIGIDAGTPLTDDYKSYARFTGTIDKVVVDLVGKRQIDPETATKIIMKKQ